MKGTDDETVRFNFAAGIALGGGVAAASIGAFPVAPGAIAMISFAPLLAHVLRRWFRAYSSENEVKTDR